MGGELEVLGERLFSKLAFSRKEEMNMRNVKMGVSKEMKKMVLLLVR